MYFIAYTLLFLFKTNTNYFKNSLLFKQNSLENVFWPRSVDRPTGQP